MFSLSGLMDAYSVQFGFTAQDQPCIADLLERDLQELDFDTGWKVIASDFRRMESCLGMAMEEYGAAETGSEKRSD